MMGVELESLVWTRQEFIPHPNIIPIRCDSIFPLMKEIFQGRSSSMFPRAKEGMEISFFSKSNASLYNCESGFITGYGYRWLLPVCLECV